MVKVVLLKTKDLIPYYNNPRRNDKAVEKVAASIQEFGFKVPIIVDKNNVIVAGHTRLRAAEMIGMDEVPCLVASDLTDEQIRAYRLADNKTNEFATWDFDKLEEELAQIQIDMQKFGFTLEKEEDNTYTGEITIPKYEPMEEQPPALEELVDFQRVDRLTKEIDEADIPEDVKEFLYAAANRHAVFDYGKIAEYYCHAPKEVQELMEKSALVIIDYDKAIEYGYTNLKDELEIMMEEDKKHEK